MGRSEEAVVLRLIAGPGLVCLEAEEPTRKRSVG